MDESAEAIASTDPRLSQGRRVRMRAAAWLWRRQLEGAMRPMGVVVVDIEVEDTCEVAASDDQHPVQAFPTHRADEAFRIGIRPGCTDRRADHAHAFGSEHLIEGT